MSDVNKGKLTPAGMENRDRNQDDGWWKDNFHSHEDLEVGKRRTESRKRGKIQNESFQLLFWDARVSKPIADNAQGIEFAKVLEIHPTCGSQKARTQITVGDLVVLQWVGLNLAPSTRVSTLEVKRLPVGDPESPKPLHSACMWGKVIKHTDSELIVRFDAGGIPTEGCFSWSELNAKPEELPVGTQVIGRTELSLMVPEPDDAEEQEIERQVQEEAARAKKRRARAPGIKARIITTKEQAEADAEWAARMAHLHSTLPPPPGDGKR